MARSTLLSVLPLLLGLSFRLQASSVTYSASDSQRQWRGAAPLESLTLEATPTGLAVTAVLEPGAFSSSNFIRDGNARFSVFEVGDYPTATLSGTVPLNAEVSGPEPLSQTQIVPFTGQLTLHGVTREVRFPVTVVREGAQVAAEGAFTVKLNDFGMTRPSLFGVVVADRVDVSASLTGVLGDE